MLWDSFFVYSYEWDVFSMACVNKFLLMMCVICSSLLRYGRATACCV